MAPCVYANSRLRPLIQRAGLYFLFITSLSADDVRDIFTTPYVLLGHLPLALGKQAKSDVSRRRPFGR